MTELDEENLYSVYTTHILLLTDHSGQDIHLLAFASVPISTNTIIDFCDDEEMSTATTIVVKGPEHRVARRTPVS